MKGLRFFLVVFASAMLLIGMGGMASAFHSGGVAECGGCHSMHAPKTGGSNLLIGSDQSSTCLDCHESPGDTAPSRYHVSTAEADMPAGVPPIQRSPGGDFGWLKKTYTFSTRGTATTEEGERHGHNVVALDKNYIADKKYTTAPGGTFPSSQLGCQSCHDPHGQARRLSDGTYVRPTYKAGATNAPIIGSGSYDTSLDPAAGQAVGVYRILRAAGDDTQGVTFQGVPIAIAPATYNQTEATNQVRVAYGHAGINTWGNWCATCHPKMHSSGNYVHPVDESLGSDVVGNYNAYVKSGDLRGNAASSFTSLVPFMENTSTIATLKSHASNTNKYLNGPGSSDKVSCLSCHRAHASDFPNMLRWSMENEFMVVKGVYQTESRGRKPAEALAGYYDRPATPTFADYQRVLCNKCHAKD
jgi:predicted CXXCH cytochrome family protein